MSLAQRAAKGIVWGQAGKVIEAVLSFVLSVIVIRALGPEAYGKYSLLLGIIFMGLVFSWFGFAGILGKHVPRYLAEGNKAGAAALLRWTLIWRAVFMLIVLALANLFLPAIGRAFHISELSAHAWPLGALFLLMNLRDLLTAIFNAMLRTKLLSVMNVVYWSSSIVLTVLFFRVLGVEVSSVLYASIAAELLALAAGFLLLRAWFMIGGKSSLRTGPLWRFGAITWVTSLANFGLGNTSDILLLGYLLPDQTQIGFYKAAVMPVQRLIGLLFSGWSSLAMPVISESDATSGVAGVRRAWESYLKLLLWLATPVLVLLAVTAGTVLIVLYSAQYEQSTTLLQMYAMYSMLGFAAGYGLSTTLLQTLGMERLALWLRLAAGALNLGLNFLLVPRWGAAGAVIATCTAGALLWTIETEIIIHKYGLTYPWRFFGKILTAALVAAAPVLLMPTGNLPWLVAQGCAYGLVFAGICFLLKPLNPQDRTALGAIHPRVAGLVRLF